jgi:hypothetical protein
MKKKLLKLFCSVLLVLFISPAFAQPKNNIKTNLFSPLLKTYVIAFEHALNTNSSAQLGFYYTGFKISDTKLNGFAITPEYRFYLGEKAAPAGAFVAPYARYQTYKLSNDNTAAEGTYSAFGFGLLIGKQLILKDVISMEAFIGPSYSFGSVDVTSGSASSLNVSKFDGFGVRLGIMLGFAF